MIIAPRPTHILDLKTSLLQESRYGSGKRVFLAHFY